MALVDHMLRKSQGPDPTSAKDAYASPAEAGLGEQAAAPSRAVANLLRKPPPAA